KPVLRQPVCPVPTLTTGKTNLAILDFSATYWDDVIPMDLNTIAGTDLTEFEIQLVEQKRQAAKKKKAMLAGVNLVTEPAVHEEPAMETIAEAQEEATPDVETAPTVPEEQTTEAAANGEEETAEVAEAAEATENDEVPDTRVVHENFICNMCMADPIKGIRYQCAKYVKLAVIQALLMKKVLLPLLQKSPLKSLLAPNPSTKAFIVMDVACPLSLVLDT
ncbi:14767_t:CDS:2, partial [Acaulospora colombiana]